NEQELSQLFNITSIPAVLFIPANGQPQMNVGYMTKEELDKKIKDILKISK
ncbi:MAG: thiol reductase thioredoxin, partial [Bacteroidetes bacterium CG02_land_8_20_14_3_00_31_25]